MGRVGSTVRQEEHEYLQHPLIDRIRLLIPGHDNPNSTSCHVSETDMESTEFVSDHEEHAEGGLGGRKVRSEANRWGREPSGRVGRGKEATILSDRQG